MYRPSLTLSYSETLPPSSLPSLPPAPAQGKIDQCVFIDGFNTQKKGVGGSRCHRNIDEAPSPLCDTSAAPQSRSKRGVCGGAGVERDGDGFGGAWGGGLPGLSRPESRRRSLLCSPVGDGRGCGDAGEGDALPHLRSPGVRAKSWHCLYPCKPGVPPVLLPPWMSLLLCPHCSLALLPHACFPLGSSIQPQSPLLLPERLNAALH